MQSVPNSIKFLKFNTLDSTQAWAHANSDAWNPEGWTAITAGSQHAGRGSGGTTWDDVPNSSLLMTLVSPPLQWSASYVFVRHAQASMVVAAWCVAQGYDVQLKWPNDLFLGGRKLGGLLTEAFWQGSVCTRWFLGLGINVLAAPEGCASLHGLALDGMAEALATELTEALSAPVGADVLDRYSACLLGWRQPNAFRDRSTGQQFVATPRFLSPDGRLGIQLEHGSIRWIGHKELDWLVGEAG